MLGYISPVATSLPSRLLNTFLTNSYFLIHTPKWALALITHVSVASHPGIFILNDWKHLLRTETSQKFVLNSFYNNNEGTRKVKDSLINKFTPYFSLVLLNTKILSNSFHGQTSFERHHIRNPEICGKTFTHCLKKCSDGYIFSKILCPRCKELFSFKCNFVSLLISLPNIQKMSYFHVFWGKVHLSFSV